jgi:hypothetical protein
MKFLGYSVSCLAYVAAIIFSLPQTLYASGAISLADHEKKLISRGDIVVREIGNPGKPGRTFQAIGYIDDKRSNIVGILTDYKMYPDFMPNVSRIDIIELEDNEAILNYTLELPLGKIKKYRLKLVAEEAEDQASLIRWHLLKWPGLKKSETIEDTTGFWRIEEKAGNRSLVKYHVYTDPGPIPLGLGWIVNILTEKSVPETLLRTRERVEGK